MSGTLDILDESVREFLDALTPGTRKVYNSALKAFLTFYHGKSLSNFLDAIEADMKLPRRQRKRVARNVLKEFVRFCTTQKYEPKTIRAYTGAVQSFAGYYDIKISTRYVDLPSSQPASKKFPWSLEKVAEFLEMVEHPIIKSVAVAVFQSGIGIADLRALNYGDIKYEYEQGIEPLCFDLARIKTDVPFLSFIGEWGVSTLKMNLKGKKLQLDTPLYPISARSVQICFKDLAKEWLGEYKGRNPCRPYSLRAAFRTLLGDAKADRDVAEFWMGHQVPEQQRVYHSRSRDGWRALYAQYEKYLTPIKF